MNQTSNTRTSAVIFATVLSLSAFIMIWFFWHHPLKTSLAAAVALAALGISARLARAVEADNAAELEHVETESLGA
jgi:tellurite resistance protein TehA-like permease